MKNSEIYLKAAEVIETNGHYKGDFVGRQEGSVGVSPSRTDSPVCAAGALALVMFGDPFPPDGDDQYDAIVADFNARVPDFHLYGFHGEPAVLRLADWNDDHAVTATDVIDLFKRTAREVA